MANEIHVIEPDEDLPNLPVACAVWEPLPTWSTSAEAWLMAGAPHHTVLTTAVGTETIEDFAAMTDTELLVIDDATTVRGFAQELRWNDVYHHVAVGLLNRPWLTCALRACTPSVTCGSAPSPYPVTRPRVGRGSR